jgi:hypothetical protein
MKPRLKSSTKWTNLPSEVSKQIQIVFEQNFQKELGKAQVIVEGRLYSEEILLRVGYLEEGRLKQNNFEVSLNYDPQSENSALSTIHTGVDVLASLMTEHFEEEGGELEIPQIWTEFPFEDLTVWLRFTTENSNLEKKANELLGEWDDSMVKDSNDEELNDLDEDPDDDDEGGETLH